MNFKFIFFLKRCFEAEPKTDLEISLFKRGFAGLYPSALKTIG